MAAAKIFAEVNTVGICRLLVDIMCRNPRIIIIIIGIKLTQFHPATQFYLFLSSITNS
jgi:hypothetical protein